MYRDRPKNVPLNIYRYVFSNLIDLYSNNIDMVIKLTSKLQSKPHLDCMIKYGHVDSNNNNMIFLVLFFSSFMIKNMLIERIILRITLGILIIVLLYPNNFISIAVR